MQELQKIYIVMEAYTNDEYLSRKYISRIFSSYESAEEYMLEANKSPMHINVKHSIEVYELHP